MRPLTVVAALLAATSLTISARQQNEPRSIPAQQPPVFRSEVDLVAVDVQVVTRDGDPIDTLGIDDFRVSFNGKPRRVVSVDFVRKQSPAQADAGGPERPITTPGVITPGARIFVMGVDSNSLAPGALKPVVRAAQDFLRQLDPDDLVALYVYPFEKPLLDLTHDHFAVSRALDRIVGNAVPFGGRFSLSLSEAIDIAADDGQVFKRVADRECDPRNEDVQDPACRRLVQMEARMYAEYLNVQGMASLRGVNVLLDTLALVPGRKTVVFISGGMPATDRPGGRPSLAESMTTIGGEAGRANASVYVLHLDNTFSMLQNRGGRPLRDPTAREESSIRDAHLNAIGLDRLAGASGGALLTDRLGDGARAFSRVLRESSAHYLVGVQPIAEDRDGKLHYLRVDVARKGATVRSRTQVVIPVR